MGGKRPDQHDIDPRETGSSDDKWGREGRSVGERERKQAGTRQDEDAMSDDDRVDEASRESFPASDPPAQP